MSELRGDDRPNGRQRYTTGRRARFGEPDHDPAAVVRATLIARLEAIFARPAEPLRLLLRAVSAAGRLVSDPDPETALAAATDLRSLCRSVHPTGRPPTDLDLVQLLQHALFPEEFAEPDNSHTVWEQAAELRAARDGVPRVSHPPQPNTCPACGRPAAPVAGGLVAGSGLLGAGNDRLAAFARAILSGRNGDART